MGLPGLISWSLLGVAVICLAQNQQKDGYFRQVIYDPNPVGQSRQRRDNTPRTIRVGNVTVLTGANWSLNVFDFVKVRRKPSGGFDVEVQPPKFLSKMFPPNGSRVPPIGDPDASQDMKRARPKLISSSNAE
ncbi:uncharacterized protein LOC110836396 [Zootermopsis nevadensis]|uniref:Uncharacterized protein n=1 Tax=Zootermopsis nevadensis TaxID=136037 RepID=A0A067QTN9_ZOONE|nr:uncharacterized protein LOC110836396 [Zootermopsis nevadensis]KDR12262.1 hypothetical protein L798_13749 [Zootermopsis nevadensis]